MIARNKLYLFTALGLSLGLSVGVAVGVNTTNNKNLAAVATGTIYNLTSNNGGWVTNDTTYNIEDGGTAVSVTFGDNWQFKFVHDNGWDGALGISALQGESTARSWFGNDDGTNIKCLVGGTYDVSIKNGKVYIDLQNSADVYVQVKDWEHTFVYMFDETTNSTKLESLGGWPGKEVSNYTVASNFNNSLGGIAKVTIPYKTLGNTKIIVTNNAGSQSGNQAVNAGYYYWNNGKEGNASNGAQAKVVYDIEKAIDATTNTSVCEVSKSVATSLVSEYDILPTKAEIDASTMYTWESTIGDGKANHTYNELVAQLRTIANSNGGAGRAILGSNIVSGNTTAYVIVAIAIVSLAGVGAFFYFRKRKVN